jgi:exonuclease SbcC
LKKKKILIQIELEKKAEIYKNLTEENKNLNLVTKNLRNKLKELKMSYNIPGNKNSNHGSKRNSKELKKSKTEIFLAENAETNLKFLDIDNKEINEIKEELNEIKLLLITKKKYLIECKKKIKNKKEVIENFDIQNFEIAEKLKLIKDELSQIKKEYIEKENIHMIEEENLKNEIEFLLNQYKGNNFKNVSNFSVSSGKILKEKETLEISIDSIRKEILSKNSKIESTVEKFNQVQQEIENNQNNYVILIRENFELKNKLQKYEKYLEKNEFYSKNIESELYLVKSKLSNNKNTFEKIEEDMNYKLYFIRFSNSLVRSFFNIINTRRIQIEMLKNLDNNQRQVYHMMFKKLDDLEINIIKEYRHYLTLCEEETEEEKSILNY